ncbi:MAG: hypothetical protein ACYC6L_03860 [Anaerolineae bacterium]
MERKLSGGIPYSEGIFEDLNKAVCAQYFWDPDQPTALTVRQYLAYEFGAQLVTPLHQAVTTLEHNLPRRLEHKDGTWYTLLESNAGAEEAWETFRNVSSLLPRERQESWRWQVLALRAQVDAELARSGGAHTPVCEQIFQSLTALYHAEDALHCWLAPPTARSVAML